MAWFLPLLSKAAAGIGKVGSLASKAIGAVGEGLGMGGGVAGASTPLASIAEGAGAPMTLANSAVPMTAAPGAAMSALPEMSMATPADLAVGGAKEGIMKGIGKGFNKGLEMISGMSWEDMKKDPYKAFGAAQDLMGAGNQGGGSPSIVNPSSTAGAPMNMPQQNDNLTAKVSGNYAPGAEEEGNYSFSRPLGSRYKYRRRY